jgi:uncharacterized membrane protein
MNNKFQFIKILVLGILGGLLYYCIELLWDGTSHWTMALLGGVCFTICDQLNEVFTWKMPLWKQQLLGAICVTILELIFGVFLNICLKLNIWDYSNLPFNLFGQICLYFSILWFFLSLLPIVLGDYLRYWLYGEEKPRYILF